MALKSKLRRLLVLGFAGLFGLAVLAACGGDPTATPTSKPPSATATATSVPPAPTATLRPGQATPTPTAVVIAKEPEPWELYAANAGVPPAAERIANLPEGIKGVDGYAFANSWGWTASKWWEHPEVVRLYNEAKAEGGFEYHVATWPDENCETFEAVFPGVNCTGDKMSYSTVGPQYLTELAAGQTSKDIFQGSFSQVIDIGRRDLLQAVDLTPYGVDADRSVGGNLYHVYLQSGYNHKYNTDLVDESELPQKFEDFMDPKWEDRLTASNFLYYQGMGYVATTYPGGLDAILDMARVLEEDLNMLIVPNQREILIQGERDLSFMDYGSVILQRDYQNSPIDWFYTDWLGVNQFIFGLLKNSPSTSAGTLAILWLMSEEHSYIQYTNNSLECECGNGYPGFGHNIPEFVSGNFNNGHRVSPQVPSLISGFADNATGFRAERLTR